MHITDMQAREVAVDKALFYAQPVVLVEETRLSALIKRPMEWFLRDLASLAKQTHPDLMLCWLRDALGLSAGAAGIQLFTGADYWRETWTIARAHLIAPHGFRYLALGFVEKPDPCWTVIGARHVQVWDSNYRRLVDDESFARDERTSR